MDVRSFKNSMSLFPTGVVIVTTIDGAGNKTGITVNSFTSVSLDPPLILFCLEKKSFRLKAFLEQDFFAINILSSEQIDICNQFVHVKDINWQNLKYELGLYSGCPVMSDVCAYLECKKQQIYDCGDHIIFVGLVCHTNDQKTSSPLVYFSRKFCALES